MRVIQKFFAKFAFLGVVFASVGLSAQTQSALPNPYKLDLRTASDVELRQVIAFSSKDQVTIVAFAGTDGPWRIVQDVGDALAAQGIPVTVAWANDEDDDIQSANVIVFAKGAGRQGGEYSTKVGYINYRINVEDGAVGRLLRKAEQVQRDFF